MESCGDRAPQGPMGMGHDRTGTSTWVRAWPHGSTRPGTTQGTPSPCHPGYTDRTPGWLAALVGAHGYMAGSKRVLWALKWTQFNLKLGLKSIWDGLSGLWLPF